MAGGSGQLRWRWVAAELLVLVAVAGLLVGVHVLVPPGVRETFALRYDAPDPVHALTAAYVHLDDAHLVVNLQGYLVGAGFAYLLGLVAGERRWFRHTVAWLLLALPMVVGMSAAAMVDRAVVSRGFSGVVAGFGGVVLVGAGVVLQRTFGVDRGRAWTVVGAMSLVVAAEILYLVTSAQAAVAGGLLVLGVGLVLVSLGQDGLRDGVATDRDGWVRLVGAVVAVGLVLAFVSLFVLRLFPSQIVGDDSVTNVLAHYLGLVYGAVIAGWGYRYWSVEAG